MERSKEELIKAFQSYMWAFWSGTAETPPCVRCYKPAVTLHEIVPRSMYTDWYLDTKWNSVPVCAECHEWAHLNGEAAQAELREAATKRLQQVGEWKSNTISESS